MSWSEISLGEAIQIKHGYAFKGEFFTDTGDLIVLTPGNFNEEGGFRLRPGKERFYSGDIPEDYVLHEGDLIIAMTEQGAGLLGSSALVPSSNRYLHNQRLGLVEEIKPDKLDKGYLYYLFNTRSVRGQISGSASGTKVRHTSPSRIYNVKVRVPDVHTQKHIASILSAYDDLIENNRRRIGLLEQAARLLYQEWFVHLRFPGHDHVPVVGGVPAGWARKKIADVCETVGGGTPSTGVADYWDGDITWVVPTDVTRNDCLALLDSERKITDKGLRESSAKMLPAQSILMTSRASVGFFALIDQPVSTNQGFINIIPHQNEHRMYMLFNLMSRVEEIRGNAKGSTYPEISKGRFREMDIIIPSEILISEFGRVASVIVQQVWCLKKTTLQLTKARDLLLPRLMNGEIAV
jgi:type I restriction enzyme, S subunit